MLTLVVCKCAQHGGAVGAGSGGFLGDQMLCLVLSFSAYMLNLFCSYCFLVLGSRFAMLYTVYLRLHLIEKLFSSKSVSNFYYSLHFVHFQCCFQHSFWGVYPMYSKV